YAGYAVQVGVGARREVWAALAQNSVSARELFASFAVRFDGDDGAEVHVRFLASLEQVDALRDDLCLRALSVLVQATVRTPFFGRGPAGGRVVLKTRAVDVPFLTDPPLRYETSVLAPLGAGPHLRVGFVARGGIRFSDRFDDFRTEVLGVMPAQPMKHGIFVP